MSDRPATMTAGRPYSEECPYNMALYLEGMIRSATVIIDSCPPVLGDYLVRSGISALMTVIGERADILSQVLDASAFCECWPEIELRLKADSTLGAGGQGADVHPST